MKGYLKYIGLIDKRQKLHFVEFNTGVNVITGKSSTGKSAMIEIFDYCFGNSDYTVPEGVITDNADLYFIVLSVRDYFLVLGRTPKNKKAFLKYESSVPRLDEINTDYFDDLYFLPMADFRVALGRYFGIDIDDTDLDLSDRNFRKNNAKAPRPSVRNFTSYLLQHQNLIANKHSLFYRFDEKEKREQTIDQFKIFSGFVSQDYFIKKQQLSELNRELKALENRKQAIEEIGKEKESKISEYLREYHILTGNKLVEENAESILSDPSNMLNKIQAKKVITDYDSSELQIELDDIEKRQALKLAQKREKEFKLREIDTNIQYAERHKENISAVSTIDEAQIHISECPFCKQKNESLFDEANKLEEAINWLNNELIKTPLLLDSFVIEKNKIEVEINYIDGDLRNITAELRKLRKSVEDLKQNRSIEEQSQKVKLRIENILEDKLSDHENNYEHLIDEKRKKIDEIETDIKENYNPEAKLNAAEKYINKAMNEIGRNLDFEQSYRPINLKFSLSSFELWHQKDNNTKVYLRSMGSGANWLYCHISLFTAIHKYFCSIGEQSLIPPILFLDQPSQVYFPASIDNNKEKFDAKELKEKEGKIEKLDEDLSSVSNLFKQLVLFCKTTSKETGITPQIIITDHADNLELDVDGIDFESLVNGRRWREYGFIVFDEVIP